MHSVLAPTSRSTVWPRGVGTATANAGRSTPGRRLRCQSAAVTVAPECPAETTAAARPSATSRAQTRMEASGMSRQAAAGSASIGMICGESTTSKRRSLCEMP